MRNVHRSTLTAATIAAMAVLGLSACSNDSSTSANPEATAAEATTSAAATTTPAMAEPAANLVGSGCAAYAEQVPEGPGSVAGMSQDPVTVAASNNPMLKTLTQALSGQLNPNVNLIDTLNGGEFTVFAPTDDAFAKIDPATIENAQDRLGSADQHPDLPRGARSGQPGEGRRHAQDRAGRRRDRHRRGQRPQGE